FPARYSDPKRLAHRRLYAPRRGPRRRLGPPRCATPHPDDALAAPTLTSLLRSNRFEVLVRADCARDKAAYRGSTISPPGSSTMGQFKRQAGGGNHPRDETAVLPAAFLSLGKRPRPHRCHSRVQDVTASMTD